MPVNRQSIKCLLNSERYSEGAGSSWEPSTFSKITRFVKQLIVPFKSLILDCPGGAVESTANEGDTGWVQPWSVKSPHATEQRSPRTIITEPVSCNYGNPCALEPVLHNKKSHPTKKPAHRNEEQSSLVEIRESHTKQTQHSQKIKIVKKKKHLKPQSKSLILTNSVVDSFQQQQQRKPRNLKIIYILYSKSDKPKSSKVIRYIFEK